MNAIHADPTHTPTHTQTPCPGLRHYKMKRKEPSSSAFFSGQTWLVVEDGGTLSHDIPSMKATMLAKKAKENGAQADVVKGASILGGHTLTPEVGYCRVRIRRTRGKAAISPSSPPIFQHPTHTTHTPHQQHDAKGAHLTHLVVSKSLGVKLSQVMQGLRLPADQVEAPPFLVVTPEWVTACLVKKAAVDPTPYVLSEAAAKQAASEEQEAKRARMVAAEEAAALAPPSKTDKHPAVGNLHVGASREVIEARLQPFPDLDPATREAFIAWGGPIVVHKAKDFPKWACQRPTPRLHPNRELSPFFEKLEEIYHYGKGDRERTTAFGRALAVIRGWPRKINSGHELKGVRHIGQGMRDIVDEILQTGECKRLTVLQTDPQVQYLLDLTRVHQVAHSTARKWLDVGYTSVPQILEELKAAPDGDYSQTTFVQAARPSQEQMMGLLYFEEYSVKMSRAQVEGLEALVREAAVKALAEKGLGPETLLLEVCGGYRRGKEENGDADVLVSCTQAEGQDGLREAMKRIMTEEMKLDMVFLKEGGVEGYGPVGHPTHEKLTSHDNMLTLIKYEGLYRRVDVISCPPDQWAFCVLGWSGTKQMEKVPGGWLWVDWVYAVLLCL